MSPGCISANHNLLASIPTMQGLNAMNRDIFHYLCENQDTDETNLSLFSNLVQTLPSAWFHVGHTTEQRARHYAQKFPNLVHFYVAGREKDYLLNLLRRSDADSLVLLRSHVIHGREDLVAAVARSAREAATIYLPSLSPGTQSWKRGFFLRDQNMPWISWSAIGFSVPRLNSRWSMLTLKEKRNLLSVYYSGEACKALRLITPDPAMARAPHSTTEQSSTFFTTGVQSLEQLLWQLRSRAANPALTSFLLAFPILQLSLWMGLLAGIFAHPMYFWALVPALAISLRWLPVSKWREAPSYLFALLVG